ncbi:hypothetical protein ACJRO7_030784 [Eucalyptus globulus]|uniref:Secreted protein n=1 Tax=Eucalyptus globulus TaxID=34317 RepID=A0ABD3JEP2_EUCGL
MTKILTSKVAVVVTVLLLLMAASMQPSEACRVLTNGHGGAQANSEEPDLVILQTLKKGPTPCTGNCGGYTPGGSTTARTTNTKAFTGRVTVDVPPRDSSSRFPQSDVAADRK